MRYRALMLVVLAHAAPLTAQQVRIRTTSTARFIELRPIARDTGGTFLADSVRTAAPITEDVELSAWGLGVQGLRAYALLRGRGTLGSDLLWPRADDHFDMLQGFVELERSRWRGRLGRQQRSSGLGLYAFDGLAATARPVQSLRFEVWGGRGLARGVVEPYGSAAIRDLDPLRPGTGTLLFGASVWVAPRSASSVSATWQREILRDRSGLVSERAAFDAQIALGPYLLVSTSADADLAMEAWGKARLAALVRLPRRGWLEIEAFRYRPVLDLTTIWGVFSPESHWGAAGKVHWLPRPNLTLRAGAVVRWYEPEGTTSPFLALEDRSTQLLAGATLRRSELSLDGTWRLTTGYGGAQSAGEAGLTFAREDRWSFGMRGAVFQEEAAFRVADGTVYGAGIEARGPLGPETALRLDFTRYWHRRQQGTAGADWSQTRGAIVIEHSFGASADRRGEVRQ